jgi:tetratricopeptide (TPR) repeat protein
MKIFITTLFLTTFVFFQSGCSGSVSSNNAEVANSGNANIVVAPAAEDSPAPPVENAAPEVVPTFTDANEALAAGSKYLDDNKTEQAIDALKQATKLNPELAEAHFKLGIAYSLQENEQKAAQEVTEEATPTPAATKSKKGKKDEPQLLTNSDKSFANAARVYEKIVKKDPKDHAAFFNLGRAYNKINKDTEAEKALRQAVKLNPEDTEYQTELGAILNKLAQYDEAVTVLKKVVESDETNLRAADLLEKAEAGKKRTNYGIKPKLPAELEQKMKEAGRPRGAAKPKAEDAPAPAVKESAPSTATPPPAKPNN